MPRILVLSSGESNLMRKWCHVGQSLLNWALFKTILGMWLLCWYYGFRQSCIHLVFMDTTYFSIPHFCLNDAAAIVLHQSNHWYFLVKVYSQREVEVQQYCDKRLSFPGVTAYNLTICRNYDWFPSQWSSIIYQAVSSTSRGWLHIVTLTCQGRRKQN